jgi:hypothetical protein
MIFSRSNGETQVLETAPAIPPARRCFMDGIIMFLAAKICQSKNEQSKIAVTKLVPFE